MWDFACPDWAQRIRDGRSLIPELPLFEDEARLGLDFFDMLQLPDVQGTPRLREAAGQWFRDIARTLFGSRDPSTNVRHVSEIFAMVPKGNSKTSYGAGLMLTALLMNMRPRAEFLFVGPTQAIADLAFSQADGMVKLDAELSKRFHVRDHLKEIVDRTNGAKLKIKTFALDVLTGPKPCGVLLDELHLLGRVPYAGRVLRQIRGGLEKMSEGFLVFTTTQSDERPSGAFKEELAMAREIRDGKFVGRMLPILYEFPEDIARDPTKWADPRNWRMVLPNLGRSLRLNSLEEDFRAEAQKGESHRVIWASQHLNVEVGSAIGSDAWVGAEVWPKGAQPGLTLAALIERCDVAVAGIDAGGLDDLFGLCVIGREKGTRRWLHWAHAWAHRIVLERRKSIAAQLLDFAAAGDLTIVENPGDDIAGCVEKILLLEQAGILAEENAVGLDPAGVGAVVDALAAEGIGEGRVVGVSQGFRLQGAIKTVERKVEDGTLVHGGSALMAWCVANAKIEMRGNATMITKAASGTAKIDPLMATFDAADLMARSPEAPNAVSIYDLGERAGGFLVV